ncbi:MAG: hypothetical protein JSW08_02845 [archaeon]|nr:MAG: hypothetical protein JSW08_02845 [archaeon]
MKRGLFFIFVAVFIFSIKFVSAQPTVVISNEWINAAILFVILFTICFVALKKVFHASPGMAIVFSVIFGVAGSLSIIARYGVIFDRVDWWIVIIVVLILIAVLMQLSKHKSTSTVFLFFVIPIAWYGWGASALCPPRGTFSTSACTILNAVMGIILAIGVILLIRLFVKKGKEMGAFDESKRIAYDKTFKGLSLGIKLKPALRFWAKPTSIKAGEQTVLNWVASKNTERVIISPGLGDRPRKGHESVTLTRTTKFVATAYTKEMKTAKKEVVVTVSGEKEPTQPEGQVILRIKIRGHGNTNPPGSPKGIDYPVPINKVVVVTAEPVKNSSAQFSHWEINGHNVGIGSSGNIPNIRMKMDRNYELTAVFTSVRAAVRISANPTEIFSGDKTKIEWASSGVAKVNIEPAIGKVKPNTPGSKLVRIKPPGKSEFKIIGRNKRGKVVATFSCIVNVGMRALPYQKEGWAPVPAVGSPKITHFRTKTPVVSEGDLMDIEWATIRADKVYIDLGRGRQMQLPVKGRKGFEAIGVGKTVLTLMAMNKFGRDVKRINIDVKPGGESLRAITHDKEFSKALASKSLSDRLIILRQRLGYINKRIPEIDALLDELHSAIEDLDEGTRQIRRDHKVIPGKLQRNIAQRYGSATLMINRLEKEEKELYNEKVKIEKELAKYK